MRRPKVCILRTAGTNCDMETHFAFSEAGADVELVHINSLINQQEKLDGYQILAIPGGFSYGDDIAAGKILASELKYKLIDPVKKFTSDGKLIIGICNGFQILVKCGLMPGNNNVNHKATLTINDSAKFEDRWIYLRVRKCIWTKNMPEVIYLPVAHGEGKFITKDKTVLQRLKKNNQIIFQYCDEKGKPATYPYNPNGSEENIAGISDETGRILGLMPHPERHILLTQHPRWHTCRQSRDTCRQAGLQVFRNGVEYAKKLI